MATLSSISIEELVRRCASSSDPELWQEFVNRLHSLIAKIVYRVAAQMGDCSCQTVDDLIQETYLRLCAKDCQVLRNFEHRHDRAFLNFIQVIAANVTRDHFRSAYVRKTTRIPSDDATGEDLLPATAESAGSSKTIEREILIREVECHLEKCTTGPDQERNRKIFWLYYRTGLSASEIAALPGIGLATKGVETLILRMGKEVRCCLAESRDHAKSVRTHEGTLPAESF